jgi:xanthine dehydrogenase accessory factor
MEDEALHLAKADWPDFGLISDVRPALEAAMGAGREAALVTLYTASGGAPRGIGAQMVVTEKAVTGYLSGGCIEADVTRHALDVLADGQPRRLIYGEGGPLDVRLPCGGRIDLLVERISPDDPAVSALLMLSAKRMPGLWLSNGERRICLSAKDDMPPDEELYAAFLAGRQDRARAGCQDDMIYRLFTPQQRFIVFGHDPTALAMAMLAQQVGMDTILVRPKGPLSPPPVPGILYRRERPADALAAIGADPWTAVAVAMHQEEDDHEALVAALSSQAGYVGLLGSSRRLPRKLARLTQAGVSAAQLKRLKAPIGLKVGGHSPWEIATGVIAEVIQTANEQSVRPSSVRTVAAA